jgi:hypothetical protein
MTRLAGFPVVKTLEEFNYDFAKRRSAVRSKNWLAWDSWSGMRTWCWWGRAE